MNTQEPNLVVDAGQRTYTVIDNWLFDAPLSAYEKLIFVALKRYAWAQSRCFPSLTTLSQDTSTSPDTVDRAIKGLIEKGLVRRVSGKTKGLANVYFLGPFDDLAVEGTADSGRGTAISGRGTAISGRGTADSGRGTADSGRGVPLSAVLKEIEIDKSLSLSSTANETKKDDPTQGENQTERDREIFLILMNWKKIFGAAPPNPCEKILKRMDYMLFLSREGKISPRVPLAYLKKMTDPPAEFAGIGAEEIKIKADKRKEEKDEIEREREKKATAERNVRAAKAWRSLSEAEQARHGSFLRFRAEWSKAGE